MGNGQDSGDRLTYDEALRIAEDKVRHCIKNGYRYIEIQPRKGAKLGFVLIGHLFYRGHDVVEFEGYSSWMEVGREVARRLVKKGFADADPKAD